MPGVRLCTTLSRSEFGSVATACGANSPRTRRGPVDINMPNMDGLELLAELKQRHPDLPVMMVTAYGDDERRRRARELGASEFISKPVDFDQLKEQLRQLPTAPD